MNQFFMMSPDLFCVVSSQGYFVRLNPAWEATIGYPSSFMVGRHYSEFVHPDDLELTTLQAEIQETGLETFDFVNRYRCSDGRFKWLEWRGKTIGEDRTMYAVARDITESKAIRDKLSERDSLLGAITDAAVDPFIMLDDAGRITFWNKAATKLLGYTESEVIGKNLHRLIAPERYWGRHDTAFPKFVATGEGAAVGKTIELHARHRNGDEFPVELSLTAFRYLDQWCSIGILHDIRERVAAREALKASEARFHSSFELPLIGFTITSPEKGWLEINSALSDMLGYSREELNCLTWAELTHPDDLEADVAQYNRLISGEIDRYVMEKRYIRKNGEVVWTIMSAGCVRKPDGSVDYLVAAIQDITRRKQAEDSAIRERSLLRTLIDNLPDTIYVKDIEGRKVLANPSDWKLLGCASEEEALGKTDLEMFSGETGTRGYSDDMAVLQGKLPIINREEDFVEPSGNVRWLHTSKIPLLGSDGAVRGLMGIGRDITDRRTSEQQLAEQAAEMKDLIVTKDKFFSIIAHDLRGPLGSFMSLTRVMSEELNEMSLSRIQEISLALSKSSARLFDMLENLLEWSRMQRGLVAFEPEAIPLDCWLAGIVHAFGEQARAKGIIIQTVVEPGLEMTADNRMMESTLRNLISNAIKFTNTGGKVWVSAHAGSGGGRIITVRDSGIGMDEEMLSRLFRIDVNAGRPGTDGESSSGLGLLLCKEFVERHGGTIMVSSDPGQGTSFSVELPEMPAVTG